MWSEIANMAQIMNEMILGAEHMPSRIIHGDDNLYYNKIIFNIASEGDSLEVSFADRSQLLSISLEDADEERIPPEYRNFCNWLGKSKKNKEKQTHNCVLALLHQIKRIYADFQGKRKYDIEVLHSHSKYEDHDGATFSFLCFHRIEGKNHADTIDEVIQFVEDRKNKPFRDSAERISKRWAELGLSKEKDAILKDFIQFQDKYKEHAFSGNEITLLWVKDYFRRKQKNPFVTLSLHRRAGLFCCFFNWAKTDSIKLFEKFLESEGITPELKGVMAGGNLSLTTPVPGPVINF